MPRTKKTRRPATQKSASEAERFERYASARYYEDHPIELAQMRLLNALGDLMEAFRSEKKRGAAELQRILQDALDLTRAIPATERVREIQAALLMLDLEDTAVYAAAASDLKQLRVNYAVYELGLNAPDPQREPDPSILTDEEVKILTCIVQHGAPMKQGDVATATSLGDGVVKVSMQSLERWGYLHRPRGKHTGYAETAKGKEYVSSSESL